MPHSMFGSRGRVRFRGKLSPRFRKALNQSLREEKLRSEAEQAKRQADVAKRLLAEAKRPLLDKVKASVKGFTRRIFQRRAS